jgi:hypothetical protein
MRKRMFAATVLGCVLVVAVSASRGSAAETGRPGAAELVGLVGTVVAVTPDSRTVVVDVPLERKVLRVGATVPEGVAITKGGRSATLGDLGPGLRVRIDVRRVPTGNEALSVTVLSGTSG